MAFITIATVYHTVTLGLLILIAKGWHFVCVSLNRQDVTSLLVIMGFTYISYSSMFVTANISSVDFAMDIVMNVFHLAILLYTLKCGINTAYKVLG